MATGLSLIFLAGLLGSSHCVGMCGGFAILLGMHASDKLKNFTIQLQYSLGRIFTYSFLGAIAGVSGQRIDLTTNTWINVSAILCAVAGLFLIYQGLLALGIRIRRKTAETTNGPCLLSPILANFLRSERRGSTFLAGVLTGFLPCGLVYAFLTLAVASKDLMWGTAVMAVFGAGTVPIMVATGVGGNLLSLLARQRLLRLAAWSVVLTGVLTLIRGISFAQSPADTQQPVCPFCVSVATENESFISLAELAPVERSSTTNA